MTATMDTDTKLMMDQILRETGWQANFAFPAASKENSYLLNLLSEVKVKCKLLDDESEQYKEKNNKLRTHLCMIEQERHMTESLLLARQKECDQGKHELVLAELEIGRIKQDMKKIENEKHKIQTRISSLQNEIFIKSNELNSMKSQMDLDQQMIDIYLDECEEDTRVRERLELLQRKDDSKLATLNSEAGKLSEKRQIIRNKLDVVVSKNDALRLRVDAASERCRIENKERREILRIWESCVAQMAGRDENFTDLSKQYNEMIDTIKQHQEQVKEVKNLSKLIVEDVKSATASIEESNKEIAFVREQLKQAEDDAIILTNELLTQRRTVERTEQEYRSKLGEIKQLKQITKEIQERLTQVTKQATDTELLLAKVIDKRLNAEQLAKLADQSLADEEKCQKVALNYHEKLKKIMIKTSEELESVKNRATILKTQIEACKNNLKGLRKKARDSENDLIKLDELIYKAQLYGQRIEQRIAKLEHNPLLPQEELSRNEKRIMNLQKELDSRVKSCNTLTSMISQFQNEKRICKMRTEKLQNQMSMMQSQLDAAHLTMNNTRLALKKAEVLRQELLVTYNLDKYQVRRMEAQYRMLKDTVLSAQTKQLQLDALEQEFDLEITTRKNNLMGELHLIEINLAEIKSELNKRHRRLEHVKSRYDVSISAVTKPDEDEVGSRMRYLLQALEERQELKRKGDELDQMVRRAEEELRALENTVVVMNSLNENARLHTQKNVINETTTVEKQTLERVIEDAEINWTELRQRRRSLRATLLNLDMQTQALDATIGLLTDRFNTAVGYLDKAVKSAEEARVRCERANKLLRQTKKSNKYTEDDKSDIEVRLWRDFNRIILQLYDRCIKNSPALNDSIVSAEHNIAESMNLKRDPSFGLKLPPSRDSTKPLSRNSTRISNRKPLESQGVSVISIGEDMEQTNTYNSEILSPFRSNRSSANLKSRGGSINGKTTPKSESSSRSE